MNLSKRAQTYLQSLERRAFIRDKAKVIHALEQSGITFEEWIWEIHRDFAGYVEKLHLDEAVYGIIHENPKWLPKRGFDYDIEEEGWILSCADAHPSYDFNLTNNKEFLGSGLNGPAENFEKKIERDALAWKILGAGSWLFAQFDDEQSVQKVISRLENCVVAEASDKFMTAFHVDNLLVWKTEHRLVVRIKQHSNSEILDGLSFRLCRSLYE